MYAEFKSPGNAHNDSLSTYSETRREMKSNKAKRHRSVHKGRDETDSIPYRQRRRLPSDFFFFFSTFIAAAGTARSM